MMRSFLALLFIATVATAFSPTASRIHSVSTCPARTVSTSLNIDMGEPERAALTRDSEPDDFFQTDTDKMSDGEKLPIAIMGLVGISLPFLAGMIALYAAK